LKRRLVKIEYFKEHSHYSKFYYVKPRRDTCKNQRTTLQNKSARDTTVAPTGQRVLFSTGGSDHVESKNF